jgi:hypothetical protein
MKWEYIILAILILIALNLLLQEPSLPSWERRGLRMAKTWDEDYLESQF